MRCPLGATPECKVHSYENELVLLRAILNGTELVEELKWGVPCYTINGKNVLLLSAFKDFASLSFFKGALMQDPHHWLVAPGENSQASRQLRFTSEQQILGHEDKILAYVEQSIDIERKGLQIDFKAKRELEFPEELEAAFAEDPVFETAFKSLTPGRQRGYVLHISSAKRSETRSSRIEKHMERILEGKGLHDR